MDRKVALVTGGNRGIGKEIALVLAEDGYNIALNYRRETEELENVKNEFVYKFEIVESNDSIIKQKIKTISVYIEEKNTVYSFDFNLVKDLLKSIFENENILKIGYKVKIDYILLKENSIEPKNLMADVKIAGHLLNSATNQYGLDVLAKQYLDIDKADYLAKFGTESDSQTSLFDTEEQTEENYETELDCYLIYRLNKKLKEELKAVNLLELYETIEMPVSEILAQMQYDGVYVDINELQRLFFEYMYTAIIYLDYETFIKLIEQLPQVLLEAKKTGKKNFTIKPHMRIII